MRCKGLSGRTADVTLISGGSSSVPGSPKTQSCMDKLPYHSRGSLGRSLAQCSESLQWAQNLSSGRKGKQRERADRLSFQLGAWLLGSPRVHVVAPLEEQERAYRACWPNRKAALRGFPAAAQALPTPHAPTSTLSTSLEDAGIG